MKSVDLSDEIYARLERLAAAKKQTPAEMLANLLPTEHSIGGDPLLLQLANGEFTNQPDPADRYLALLAWLARYHAADFSDFISHQESAHRYLRLSNAEINAIRQKHHTRQIEGTQYWAVMNIDSSSKKQFVRQLLEFIGYDDAAVAEAILVLSLAPHESHDSQRLRSVA